MKLFNGKKKQKMNHFSHLIKKSLFFLLILFNFGFSGQKNVLYAQQTEITTITIKNARQTSYKKSEETGNDLIVLEGSVELTVQKGETTSEISADNINYDRKTEMLYAQGNVQITTKSSASGGETTYASSLLLNTSTLEGIFDGGKVVQTQSDALNLPSGSTMIVFSDLFGKGSQNTIAFKNSSLTFCDDENPHWKIDATRTFLLPGGEFAFFNALLYVGSIPVLYLPAFYYPKDELVFNPVFSTRKREGYAIQTTTYIWGRKPLDSSSSLSSSSSSSSSSSDTSTSTSSEALKGLYNFVRPSTLKEQKLEGLVLHNLDQDYKGDSSQYIKVLADWYTNLGGLVGFDINLNPKNEYISKFAFSLDLGFSNTIFQIDGKYYPFDKNGSKYSDSSTFLGLSLPFRYSGSIEIKISKPISFTLSMPVYSDPFYNYDFKSFRNENMDWISYLLDYSKTDSQEVSITEVSSFAWQMNSSFSPKIPEFFKPFITDLSISLKSSVNFASKNTVFANKTDYQWIQFTPQRKFYYPSTVTPVNTSISLRGTLFSWPYVPKNSSKKIEFPITLNKPEHLKSVSQINEENKKNDKSQESVNEKPGVEQNSKNETNQLFSQNEGTTEPDIQLFDFYFPDLIDSTEVNKINDGIKYELSYSLLFNLNTQISYASANLSDSQTFEWESPRSFMYNIKAPLSLKSDFSYGDSFFSTSSSISYSPVWQEHPYISDDIDNGGYSEKEIKNINLVDYKARSHDIVNLNKVSIKPFIYYEHFSDTNLSWNSTIKLFRRNFIGDSDNEEWENLFLDWDDDKSVTQNNISVLLHANEFNKKFSQSLEFSAIMPPLLKQYNTTLKLSFPYVDLSLSTGIKEKDKSNGIQDNEKWKKNSLIQTCSVNIPVLSQKIQISQSYSYNQEDKYHENLKISLSWNGLSLSYLNSYTTGYDLQKEKGWISRDEKEFLPYSLTLSYVNPSKTYYKWANRISFSPNINASLVYDFIRPVYSYFVFSPSITFKINRVIDLTFSSTSRNSVLYWYFHNEPGDFYNDGGCFPFNMFVDLFNSFRFDKKSLREKSGFKLKSLNMTLSHDLHDWKLNMTLKIEPRVITENGIKRYDFSPYFTIGVVWNPMESIKTTVTDKYGEFKLE